MKSSNEGIQQMKNALYEILIHNSRRYITSHKFHEEVKPTQSLSATNKSIRNVETYQKLLENEHIVEIDWQLAKTISDSEMELLIQSNSYKPIMLIDPVAQKAIEHHFKETAPQAVQSSKENAMLGLAGIDLSLLAQDPFILMTMRAMSASLEAKQFVKKEISKMNSRVDGVEERVELMNGDTGYATVLAYTRLKKSPVSLEAAKQIGQVAKEQCKAQGFPIGKVPDERFGSVNSYPKEILDQIFRTTN